MSIKYIHIFLISSSICLLVGFGFWGIQAPDAVHVRLGAVSMALAPLLGGYLFWFVRKSHELP